LSATKPEEVTPNLRRELSMVHQPIDG
jgi:hypothetical protein